MAVSFTLTPSKLVKKAKDKGYKFLSDNLLTPTIQNGLPEKNIHAWGQQLEWCSTLDDKNK